jgi:Tol biopolymer transport system component
MAEHPIHPQLQRAISLAQSGRIADAHALLHKITSEDPTQELAWLWLVQTEPDHQQRIQILEECLRYNPQSEYARKGLAGFRTGPLSGVRPPGKPPTYFRPKQGTGPLRRSGCRWKTLLALAGLAAAITLIVAAILFYPWWRGYAGLPEDPVAMFLATSVKSPTLTRTIPPPPNIATRTATRTNTPTVTRTATLTFTASLTRTATPTPLPTLYQGVPVADEPALLFLDSDTCAVQRLPISGGTPEVLTTEIAPDCAQPRISPDGQRLVFLGSPPDAWIAMTNLNGSRRKVFTKLTANTGEGRTIWAFEFSPNGQMVGFVASGFAKDSQGALHVDDSFGFLYTAPIGSGYAKQQKALGVDATLADMITWSPDGEWVFSFDRGNPLENISYPFAFRASDSRTVWISQEDPYLGHYDWSPDSKYLASLFPKKPSSAALPENAPADQNYIIISGLDETKHYIPLQDKGYDPKFGARWFPDQKSFLLYQASAKRLVAVSEAGVLEQTVAELETAPAYAAWSPDGQWLVIVEKSSGGNNGTLMIAHPDGTDLRILARNIRLAPVVWR